jgi:DNA-binding LytR/AlgR family response regulator
MTLRCMALDAEKTVLAEISFLLDQDPRVGQVIAISDPEQASSALKQEKIDAVFVCLVHHTVEQVNTMLAPYAQHTKFVALSRKAEDAMHAFEFGAIDYILKPLTKFNIERAILRLEDHFTSNASSANVRIKIEHNGTSYFVPSSEVFYIQSNGDFSIVTTPRGDFVARASLAKLSQTLAEAGFERVHRQWLVQLSHVDSLVNEMGCTNLRVAGKEIPVSRRCVRNVRQKLA